MLFQPAIMALILASVMATGMVASSIPFALRVLRRWDLSSGSEAQLVLERRTYLVSTVLKLVLLSQAAALILFVFNADRMATLFTGAMCAVGTLRVDPFGFPTLYLKIAVFFSAVAWLVLNHVDNLGWNYPLIRVKYAALLVLAPLLAAELLVQLAYFLGLRADVITSCCSTLFSGGSVTITDNSLASLPHRLSLALLGGIPVVMLAGGLLILSSGRGGVLYAGLAGLAFAAGLAAVISTVSVYVYELPQHHCPFCLLKDEYGGIGYALYLPLFAGTACGLGVGIASWAQRQPSLKTAAPAVARRLACWSMAGFALFASVSAWLILRSNLILLEPVSWRLGWFS